MIKKLFIGFLLFSSLTTEVLINIPYSVLSFYLNNGFEDTSYTDGAAARYQTKITDREQRLNTFSGCLKNSRKNAFHGRVKAIDFVIIYPLPNKNDQIETLPLLPVLKKTPVDILLMTDSSPPLA